MEHKTFDLVETKTEGDAGTFTALVSVFGNVDSVGDRMLPGSFTKTLDNWRQSGDPIPVILSHQWDDPMAMIGKADPRAVFEDDRGLVVQGSLDLENEVARQVYKLMKDRLLKGWSFGYTVPKGGQKRDKKGVNEVSEVDLFEVGPTLKGANPEAQLETIKTALPSTLSPEEALAEFERRGFAERKGGEWVIHTPETKTSPPEIKDAPDEEPEEAKSQAPDPLSKRHARLAFELATDGIDMAQAPEPKVEDPAPRPSRKELERQFYDMTLEILTGSE